MEDLFKNFAMCIPSDVSRHPDGTPCSFVSPEDKEAFTEWVLSNRGNEDWYEKLSGKEKEELFLFWKNQSPTP